jgi:hypothetical protein
MRGVAEEAPGAYNDVGEVVDAVDDARLSRKVARLEPLACITSLHQELAKWRALSKQSREHEIRRMMVRRRRATALACAANRSRKEEQTTSHKSKTVGSSIE